MKKIIHVYILVSLSYAKMIISNEKEVSTVIINSQMSNWRYHIEYIEFKSVLRFTSERNIKVMFHVFQPLITGLMSGTWNTILYIYEILYQFSNLLKIKAHIIVSIKQEISMAFN